MSLGSTLAVANERSEFAFITLSHWGLGVLGADEVEFCHLDEAARIYNEVLELDVSPELRRSLNATNMADSNVDCSGIID